MASVPSPGHDRPSRRRRRAFPAAAILAFGLLPATGGVSAQEGLITAPVDSVPDLLAPVVSPGGAFLRAVLLPGWGHASIGSYHRGAFYFAVEGATAWTLIRARRRLGEAEDRVAFREGLLRADLADEGITDEETIATRLDADETLQDLRDLEASRRQQREDWTAVGIFLLFLSGADAFVSAHLKDFPAPLELNAEPVGGGRMELSVGVKLPR